MDYNRIREFARLVHGEEWEETVDDFEWIYQSYIDAKKLFQDA